MVIKGHHQLFTLNEVMEETERNTIINYLEIMNGKKSETAKFLELVEQLFMKK